MSDWKEKRRAEYFAKLKDPRWQMRRLEVFKRDGTACQICFDPESTLHVHHLWYGPGEPWDVPDSALLTLCESCHEIESERRRASEWDLILAVRQLGALSADFDSLTLALRSVATDNPDLCIREYMSSALAAFLSRRESWDEIWSRCFGSPGAMAEERNGG